VHSTSHPSSRPVATHAPPPLAALACLSLLAALLLVVRAQPPRALQEVPDPAGNPLISITLPRSRLVVQNLEADRPLDGVVELRRPDGGLASRIPLEAVPPFASRSIELDQVPGLPVGIYSAAISGTGRLAALARHAWSLDPEEHTDDLAMASGSAADRDLILPYVALSGTVESSVLSVQNPATDTVAAVDIALHPFGAEGAPAAWAGRVELPAGGSATLDLASTGFESLTGRFHGFARVRSSEPVAASALIIAAGGGRRIAAALEALPASAASDAFVGYFSSSIGGRPANEIIVVNPGAAAARVQATYFPTHGLGDCGTLPISPPVWQLAPGSALAIRSDEGAVPGVSRICAGQFELEAEVGHVMVTSVFRSPPGQSGENHGTAAAYHLAPALATRWAIPHLRWFPWEDPNAPARYSTYIGMENPSDQPISASLVTYDSAGRIVPAPGHTEVTVWVRASASFSVRPSIAPEQAVRFDGGGLVEASGPLHAYVFENTDWDADAAAYAAADPGLATTSSAVPFLARAPAWPTGPAQLTPPADPTATPTGVTIVPPEPRSEPTQAPPKRRASIAIPEREGWIGCCIGLAWTRDDVLWGVEYGDGVGLDVQRYDLTGRLLGALPDGNWADRVKEAPDGSLLVLDSHWSGTLRRYDAQGRSLGEVPLPKRDTWDLRDVAVAPDGSLWLVDNRGLEAHHIAASGEHLASWSFAAALRYPPGDGGYRIAVSPDGASVYVLSWARVLRYDPDGRLLAAWGAPRFELGPDDFQAPMDLAVDAGGRVYVLEGTGRLQAYYPDGWRVAAWHAFDRQRALDDWTVAALAIGPTGQVAVADLEAGRIHVYAALANAPGPTPIRGAFRALLPWAGSDGDGLATRLESADR